MKKFIYPLMMLAALGTTACTNTKDDVINDDPSNKTAISFVGESRNTPITRAGFGKETLIAMHIRSKNSKDASKIMETRTLAKALADATLSSVSFSNIGPLNTDYVRYWDDTYGRDAELSVFAIAVPNTTNATNGSDTNNTLIDHLTGTSAWETGSLSEDVTWVVSSDQSGTNTIENEDLVYSNNIRENGLNGVYEWNFSQTEPNYKTTTSGGPMKFLYKDNKTDGPGKFDRGHLEFNHALCRVSINLIKGDGFDKAPFQFESNTNVKINNVPTKGTLNILSGIWGTPTSKGISKMALQDPEDGAAFSLMAQMLPGYVISKTGSDKVLEFTIDGNLYHVTQAMMFAALEGKPGISDANKTNTTITMEQGRNYVFDIKVSKSKVDVTASLAAFTPVNAEQQNMNNSHISVTLTDNGTTDAINKYDWYRLNDGTIEISSNASSSMNWYGNYTDKAKLTESPQGSGKWVTNWFFENNMSFYHFRAVNKDIHIEASGTDAADYFEIHSGSNDYLWGAPMVNSTLTYSEKDGYTSSISPAIGATNDDIKLTMLHMMSNIKILLETTSGDDKVDLAGSKVSISKYYKDGTVLMGNGNVSVSGSVSGDLDKFTEVSTTSTAGEFTYYVVPQVLSRKTDDYIVITIETTDGNKYIINNLSTVSDKKDNSVISSWLPGNSYTYTFKLKKTGVDVTCSVKGWENVEAKDTDVKL